MAEAAINPYVIKEDVAVQLSEEGIYLFKSSRAKRAGLSQDCRNETAVFNMQTF